ncbi:alginate O-acetyltransferase complex protein AlgI [Tistlia consotensis]|uniref:Probable alginate O-acetylase AlgI n=1 Tax=Tistlia consotensis USBA 355 TaxID=560819 RepID=A0A1Y6CNE7_9PROT|nr:MBOAT family protein [Tistlia consotensis]SMF79838.1 alginate O-acetyltransferase complex protein AlgI [Tistlia consotensis USBA 355]SNS16439.1 alginate O-acetyltransferase complex protein AlgI [Tistlia consotensis]
MLFYSGVFLLAFLPATLYAYLLLKPWLRARMLLLIGASLVFYGYWEWRYLPILGGSILVNYLVHHWLTRTAQAGPRAHRVPLIVGITANLLLLGWFKYAGWLAAMVGLAERSGGGFSLASAALPLGISFFTFQQVSMLVDTWRRPTRYDLADIAAYVSFFPQLIAGPIVRHNDLIPQFHNPPERRRHLQMAVLGLVFFLAGYLKKVYLADNLAVPANLLFAAAQHDNLNLREAWVAALSYTFQLYFDFSGYADMAIGLGLLFGFKLPTNFDSPYRATSISDFWRRWHQTLSSFLRDYLYIPLGGSRRGTPRMLLALMVTMLLGGLWHGAGWTFVLWGGFHGLLLCVNHLWRKLGLALPRALAWAVTFFAVVLGWVLFRAPDLSTGYGVLRSLFTVNARQLAEVSEAWHHFLAQAGTLGLDLISPYWGADQDVGRSIAFILLGLVISLALPNLNRLLEVERLLPPFRMPRLALATACLLAFCVPLTTVVLVVLSDIFSHAFAPPQFIYFNF